MINGRGWLLLGGVLGGAHDGLGGQTRSSESVSRVASNIPASAGVRQPMEIGVVAISCIFLCCRGDRVLFLPREREVEVSSLGSLLKRKDMAKRRARSRTERGRRGGLYPEAVAGASLQSAERGEKKMWITCVFSSTMEWPVIQSSQHHGTGSTKKPMLPRQKRAEGHWGCRKKIPDSPFKLFEGRSEAGVLVAEQLLIVRVRLRDRSSALMGWPDWLERAVLVQRVPLSPALSSLVPRRTPGRAGP